MTALFICWPGTHPDGAMTSLTSEAVAPSSGMPSASIALFSQPIIDMARTIHSASDWEKWRSRSARFWSPRSAGTTARARATRTAARSASVRAGWPSRADATSSTVAPRRSANVQLWAEQYAQPAVRLDTYIAKPTVERGAPKPQTKNGRFRRFGTMTLYERKAAGQISR
jgi:hypothetical protein